MPSLSGTEIPGCRRCPDVASKPVSDEQGGGQTAGAADAAGGGVAGGTVTILERMLAAGISEPRACEHLTRRAVHLDGELVTAPDTAAPSPTRWVINPV